MASDMSKFRRIWTRIRVWWWRLKPRPDGSDFEELVKWASNGNQNEVIYQQDGKMSTRTAATVLDEFEEAYKRFLEERLTLTSEMTSELKSLIDAKDIFASLASNDIAFPSSGILVSATFSMKFENAKRPRMVKVRTPNVANFDRKEDSHLIETWLRKRGFVNEQKEEEDNTQPVTHQESHDAVSIAAMA
jgi:DNA primase large subunit